MVIDFRKRKGAELIFFIKFNRHYLVAQGMGGRNQRRKKLDESRDICKENLQ